MKLKKSIVALLIMVLLSGVIGSHAFAGETDDYTQPIEVEDKDEVFDGNVNVTTTEMDGAAVTVEADEKAASAVVNGSVTATGDDARVVNAYGYAGNANATVNGNATATANREAIGVNLLLQGIVNVTGDLTVNGSEAVGIRAGADAGSKVNVDGNLSVSGEAAVGAQLITYAGIVREGQPLTLAVGKDFIVKGTSYAEGLILMNYIGGILADIGGDFVVTGPNGYAVGIDASNSFDVIQSDPGASVENTVKIHGDLKTNGIGVAVPDKNAVALNDYSGDAVQSVTPLNLLVEGTLDAGNVGVLILSDSRGSYWGDEVTSKEPETSFNLTVWKVKLNKNGNVAEWMSSDDRPLEPIGPGYDDLSDDPTQAATNFEKTINYIIKLEQPKKGGTIKAVDANGNALATSMGYEVAHEGDKVILKTSVAKGYKLVAAYNEDGVKQTLLKDANGDYYIVVPKGGGVYLKVELKKVKKAKKYNSGKSSNVNGAVTNAPKTGDHDHAIVWIMLMVLSLVSVAGIVTYRRRQWV